MLICYKSPDVERQNWNRHILGIEESLERLTVSK